MLKASIDIGSNSTLLLIMNSVTREILYEASVITALGKNLDKTKKLSDNSMFDTYFTLKEYALKCSEFGIKPSDIVATATEASRVALNSKAFYENILNTLGINVVLISAEGEAFYTAYGVCQMLRPKKEEVVLLDVGGASSELIKVKLNPFEIIETISLPVGSVRATDWKNDGSYETRMKAILNDFNFDQYRGLEVICVAGTLTTLALLIAKSTEYSDEIINRLSIELDKLRDFVNNLEANGKNALTNFSFVGKRIDSIIGGSLCSLNILEEIRATLISFSSYGLRYGTLLSGEISEQFRLQRNKS